MYFEEHEKNIYKPEWAKDGYDPLLLDRLLVYHSGGDLHSWLDAVNAERASRAGPDDARYLEAGDVSEEGKKAARARAAEAEIQLAKVARAAFGFDDSVLMGVALERLYEFLGYMEGKGDAAGTPHASSESSPTSPASEPIPSTSISS